MSGTAEGSQPSAATQPSGLHPGASAYSTTKGAVASLARGVAINLAPRGITVNNVRRGIAATDLSAAHADMVNHRSDAREPEDVAGLVSYRASGRASFITDSSPTIGGGYIA
jgi:3-oxoacyl-[acyl-carrier protein] reductase